MSPVVCALGAIKFKIMVPWGMWSTERGAWSKEWGARSKERGARSEERGARSKEWGARSEEEQKLKSMQETNQEQGSGGGEYVCIIMG